MINLEFIMPPGELSVIEYDVHPASQRTAIPIPDGASSVVVWLGTEASADYRAWRKASAEYRAWHEGHPLTCP
jgi:hypothetical protein